MNNCLTELMSISGKNASLSPLSEAHKLGIWQALEAIIEGQLAELRKQTENDPVISDTINEDFRHFSGKIAALKWVLELPDIARAQIEALEK